MRHAKKPVSAKLAGPYGHPFHPMLVTVPIGAWVVSLVFDIASHLVARPEFLARGSEWLIAAGVAGALVASTAGLLDLAVIPVGTAAFRTACTHMFINVSLIFCYAGGFAWRYGSDAAGHAVGAGPMTLSVACVIALAISGYLGGKLTYRYGVRVAAEAHQADGFRTAEQA
jgi:uncharacterized membrane protein